MTIKSRSQYRRLKALRDAGELSEEKFQESIKGFSYADAQERMGSGRKKVKVIK